MERVEGIEPSSQAWKARIISHYTIPARSVLGRDNLRKSESIITKPLGLGKGGILDHMTVKNKQIFSVFWRHTKPYPWAWKALLALITLDALVVITTPWYYKQFFDVLATPDDARAAQLTVLLTIVATIAGIKGVGWVSRRLFDIINIRNSSRIMADLERTAFSSLLHHSERFFSNHFAGSLVRKVRRLSRAYEVISDSILFDFWPTTITLLGALAIIYTRSPAVFLVMLGWFLLFLVGNLLFARHKQPLDERRAKLDSEVTGVLADALSNHTVVKVFTGEDYERRAFSNVIQSWRAATVRAWGIHVYSDGLQWGLIALAEVGMLYVAATQWAAGSITIGDIALFQGYFISTVMQIYSLGRAIRRMYEGVADAKEMVELMNIPYDVVDSPRAKHIPISQGAIAFDRVQFGYGDHRVIQQLSLTVASQEKVALIGPSGAGKSTIVKLLLRFADTQAGKLTIDGVPIKKYTLHSLRQQISYVPQESVLFHRTILENIRYGRPDATDAEVLEAAKRARCHLFVDRLVHKYETYVGERGVKLSGGERQRVAIARAILADAPILILDEATSSLDSESELLIQEALEELMRNRTTIVIAHRLSTIMKMDRILVISEGTLVDQGTHKQLLRKQGIYKKLWDIQAGGFLP